MLTPKEQLEIIKSSIKGELEGTAYETISQVEQQRAAEEQQQAVEGQQAPQEVEVPEAAPSSPPQLKVPHPSAPTKQPHLVNSASSMKVGFNQASGTSRGTTSLGVKGSYKKGGKKKLTAKEKSNLSPIDPNIDLRDRVMNYMHSTGRDTNQVNTVQSYIAEHESKNTPSKIQVSEKEVDGKKVFYDGPGRGKYQFEMGELGGANTALNHTALFFKDKLNMDLIHTKYKGYENIYKYASQKGKKTDFSKFSKKEQEAIFLAQSIYGGTEKRNAFDKLVKNNKRGVLSDDVYDYWLKYHKVKSTKADEKTGWKDRTKKIKRKVVDANKNNISDYIEPHPTAKPSKPNINKMWGW